MTTAKKPLVLIIMDGWGYSENPANNAIMAANTPNLDKLWMSLCFSQIYLIADSNSPKFLLKHITN